MVIKFNQTPHPLIEDHYHIQELIHNQEKRHEDRVQDRERKKTLEERDELIKDSRIATITDFLCVQCNEEFKSQAIRQVEEDWTANQRIAFYKSKCTKGHWCIRLITDRNRDAFFQKSRSVARDRGAHHVDILQSFESGYNMVYGKNNARLSS